MLARFKSKKASIVNALRKPDEDYEDLSPKGSLDAEIREMVEEINNLPDYVTTSSCAGRVAVYLEGEAKGHASVSLQDAPPRESGTSAPASGKGGGKWLFVSHTPVDLNDLTAPGAVCRSFGLSRSTNIAFPPADTIVRFVHLKFEPMILHVLTGSAEAAQTMLGAGMAAGFRESGISGIVDNKGRPSMPMVAIRSSGLAMDCIIGFHSPATQQIVPMVSEEYLRTMIAVTNERFQQNVQRKERFRQGLMVQFAGSLPVPDDWKSDFGRKGGFQSARHRKAEKRAADMRKKEEALERRAQALHRGGALDGPAGDGDGENAERGMDDLALDILLAENGPVQQQGPAEELSRSDTIERQQS